MASKAHDRRVIPLWHPLHQELHTIGQHTFAEKHGLDYEAIIDGLNQRYEEALNGN
jgi:hypothetical protein